MLRISDVINVPGAVVVIPLAAFARDTPGGRAGAVPATVTAPSERPRKPSFAVRRALKAQAGGLTLGAIAKGIGRSTTDARPVVRKLIKAGYVRTVGKGRGLRYVLA